MKKVWYVLLLYFFTPTFPLAVQSMHFTFPVFHNYIMVYHISLFLFPSALSLKCREILSKLIIKMTKFSLSWIFNVRSDGNIKEILFFYYYTYIHLCMYCEYFSHVLRVLVDFVFLFISQSRLYRISFCILRTIKWLITRS